MITQTTKNLILGSLKSTGAIAFGAVVALYKVAPQDFNFNSWTTSKHTLWVILGIVGTAELRYVKQWLSNGSTGLVTKLTGGDIGTTGGSGAGEGSSTKNS
jgi:hypothetical protein